MTVDEWNQYLVTFHRTFDDTSSSFARFRDAQGRTSYEVLAQRLRELAPHARDVLDVGCGDGTLLREISRVYAHPIALHGVDLSEAEVARARAALPQATIRCADAAAGLGRANEDAIVSHLSLMIVARIRAVLHNAAEALRPGGVLAFVAEDPGASDSIFTFVGSVFAAAREQLSVLGAIPEQESLERDSVVFAVLAQTGFGDASIERFSVRASLRVEELWHFVERTYVVGLLDYDLREKLRALVVERARGLTGGDGHVAMSLPLRLVTARLRA